MEHMNINRRKQKLSTNQKRKNFQHNGKLNHTVKHRNEYNGTQNHALNNSNPEV